MAGFQSVWSIDIGKSALKAVRMRRERNSLEIAEVDRIEFATGGDGVDAASEVRNALEVFTSRHAVRDAVVVSHPGQGAFSRFIKLPQMDSKRLDEMVGYEAAQLIAR